MYGVLCVVAVVVELDAGIPLRKWNKSGRAGKDCMMRWSCGLQEMRLGFVWFLPCSYQLVPEGFGAGLVELGGISFMVLKKSTSWPGTSANTLLASASRGAWGSKEGVQKLCKMVRGRTSTLFWKDWLCDQYHYWLNWMKEEWGGSRRSWRWRQSNRKILNNKLQQL